MKRAYSSAEKTLFAAPLLFIVLGVGAFAWRRAMPLNIKASDVTDITSLSFSPDGKKLAVSLSNENNRLVPIQVFDLESRNKLYELEPPAPIEGGVAWSPDGERLVGGYTEYGNGPTRIANPPRPDKKPSGFRFNDMGKFSVWDAGSGTLIGNYLYAPKHEDSRAGSMRYSDDGKNLIGEGQTPSLFDATTGKRLRVLSRSYYAQVNLKLGLVAQIGGKKRRVQIIDLKTGSRIWESGQTMFDATPLQVSSWQGDVLVLAHESPPNENYSDITWSLWDAKTRSLLTSPSFNPLTNPQVNADGKTIAFIVQRYSPPTPTSRTSDTRELVVWDCTSNRTLWRQQCSFYVSSLNWSPDGKWFSMIEESPQDSLKRLKVFDRSGHLSIERVVNSYIAVWSPDSHQIAVASSERTENRTIEFVKVGE